MCGGRRYMGNLYLLLSFAVNLKLFLKIKTIFKKTMKGDPIYVTVLCWG